MRDAASAPASVEAFTAATSPSTKAVTSPDPTDCQPVKVTFADFSIASVASNSATKPFVSIIPSACFIESSLVPCEFPKTVANLNLCQTSSQPARTALLEQFNVLGQMQAARVGLVGVHVNVEPRVW